ncbi:hypothetical protein LZK98_04720 [Sphingomonas cannabina]|uniref:hypothetical protein n=1 Tax=Sphingomonas cannabina TaxID=2899123 RepID=UPI001F27BB56|nr:hypothetical protein [Sphingomonas cannabina]UIJ46253.1 hypothetical protein LZK98_04720 [Sphingomonas cannabina]
MTMISIIRTASRDAYPALLAGLQHEFGRDGAVEIATRFLEAEAADCHWESRTMERHLGAYESLDDDGGELERVAIAGTLRDTWFVAICIVDGDGVVHDIRDLRLLESEGQARAAFEHLR